MQKQEGFYGEKSVILNDQKILHCRKHEFCSDLHITDIGYYPRANYHGKERPSGCDQFVLIYCEKGKGSYELNQKRHHVIQNQFFILPANKPHKYAADLDEPWSIYWVHFSGKKADFFYNQLSKSEEVPQNVIANTTRKIIFEDILHHLELSNNFDNIIYGNCFLYSYLASFQTTEIKISLNENDMIQQCIQLMKQNLDKNLKLADFSRILNISSSHLSATFKNRMQYSPIHLYTTYKIQKACQLLVGEPKLIKNIAYELGFDDQYHFSRVFKNEVGLSPKQFRDKQML
jgi:AraC family transcriptional regulator, arabinose operon regulatory protein